VDRPKEASALYFLGQTASSVGDFAAAQAHFETALPVARPLGGETLAQILTGLGSNAWQTGDLEAAEAYIKESLSLAEAQGAVALKIQAINLLGLIAGVRSDLDTEEACYEQCLALSRQIGDLYREAIALANLGVIAVLRRSFQEAIDYLNSCLEIFSDLGRLESVALNLGNLAESYLQLGDTATARRHIREMLRLSRQLGARPRILNAVLIWAETVIAEGDPRKALALIGLIRDDPAREYQMQQEVDRVIHSVDLSEADKEAALAAGVTLNLDDVIEGILAG
jgi:tetratricopeptide (TPR) repeat protein